jgi:hypothetical protein
MEGASPPVDAVQSTATPMAAAPADPQEQNVDAGPQNLAVKSNAEAGSKVDSKGLDGSAPAVVKKVEISGEQREKVVQAAKEAEQNGLSGSSDLWSYLQTMLLIQIWGQVFRGPQSRWSEGTPLEVGVGRAQ